MGLLVHGFAFSSYYGLVMMVIDSMPSIHSIFSFLIFIISFFQNHDSDKLVITKLMMIKSVLILYVFIAVVCANLAR